MYFSYNFNKTQMYLKYKFHFENKKFFSTITTIIITTGMIPQKEYRYFCFCFIGADQHERDYRKPASRRRRVHVEADQAPLQSRHCSSTARRPNSVSLLIQFCVSGSLSISSCWC